MNSTGTLPGGMKLELSGADIALLAAGAGLAFWAYNVFEPLSPWQVFKSSLFPGLALAGSFVFRISRRLKLRSEPFTFKSGGLAGGAGLLLGVWGGLMLINGFPDNSVPVSREVRAVSKFAGNKSSYRITLSAGAGSAFTHELRPRRREFDLIDTGTPCTISTKKGFLGFEWIAGILCNSGGRYIGSGNLGGAAAQGPAGFASGFFREVPAP